MGEAAEIAGDGGAAAGDGGAGDACALRCGRRAIGLAAQHTAARRRVRTGRASTVTSPLSGTGANSIPSSLVSWMSGNITEPILCQENAASTLCNKKLRLQTHL